MFKAPVHVGTFAQINRLHSLPFKDSNNYFASHSSLFFLMKISLNIILQFQKRNYAKMTWDRCGKKGFGLRLDEDISRGQFLIEYVGEVTSFNFLQAADQM